MSGVRRGSLKQLEAACAVEVTNHMQKAPRRASRIILPDLSEEICRDVQPLTAEHQFILGAVPELKRLPTVQTQRTAINAFESGHYKAGAIVLGAGTMLDSFYLVKSGEFATYAKIFDNGRTPLCIFRAGERMGESCRIDT